MANGYFYVDWKLSARSPAVRILDLIEDQFGT